MKSLIFSFLILYLAILGCQRDNKSIEIYRTPKMVLATEKKLEDIGSDNLESDQDSNFVWQLPKNWKQVETGIMRLASFQAQNNIKASLSILGGNGGGLENNIGRWQGQLGADSKIARAKFKNKKLGEFKLIDLQNQKSSQALLVCVFDLNSQTLYAKLEGDAAGVRADKNNLVKFCESLNHAK